MLALHRERMPGRGITLGTKFDKRTRWRHLSVQEVLLLHRDQYLKRAALIY